MNSKRLLTALAIILSAVVGIVTSVYPGSKSYAAEDVVGMQDVRLLDRRISLLEQRIYSIESSINRLEQSAFSQRSQVPVPGSRDQEFNLIRDDLQKLNQRLSEVECGLLRLDERTATSTSDTRRSGGAKDPCRTNPTMPLRLSIRP